MSNEKEKETNEAKTLLDAIEKKFPRPPRDTTTKHKLWIINVSAAPAYAMLSGAFRVISAPSENHARWIAIDNLRGKEYYLWFLDDFANDAVDIDPVEPLADPSLEPIVVYKQDYHCE